MNTSLLIFCLFVSSSSMAMQSQDVRIRAPLGVAVEKNQVEQVKAYLAQGISPNYRMRGDDGAPLHYAIRIFSWAQSLLQSNYNENIIKSNKALQIIQQLLEAKADVNALDLSQQTPIMILMTPVFFPDPYLPRPEFEALVADLLRRGAHPKISIRSGEKLSNRPEFNNLRNMLEEASQKTAPK